MPKQKNKSTGPKTEAGKQASSQNALTHGCCSTKRFLPGDNQAAYDRLLAKWTAIYQSETTADIPESPLDTLIDRLATNEWLLVRAENRYLTLEQHLGARDVVDWTEDEQKKLDRLLRYRTAAERSFYRSYTVIESLRTNQHRQDATNQRLAFTRERLELARRRAAPEPKPSKAAAKSKPEDDPDHYLNSEEWNTLTQFIQITPPKEEGQPSTANFIPPNAELLQKGRNAKRPVAKVWRKLVFDEGIPADFHWTRPELIENMANCHGFAQSMSFAEWQLLLKDEQGGLPGPARPGAEEEWVILTPPTQQTPIEDTDGPSMS